MNRFSFEVCRSTITKERFEILTDLSMNQVQDLLREEIFASKNEINVDEIENNKYIDNCMLVNTDTENESIITNLEKITPKAVKCIAVTGLADELTLNKKYDVISENLYTYTITNDKNELVSYLKDRFKKGDDENV